MTDVGKRRDNNEDSLSIGEWQREKDTLHFHVKGFKGDREFERSRFSVEVKEDKLIARYREKEKEFSVKADMQKLREMQVLTVCDGMGGHKSGEVASAFVAEYFPPAFMAFLIKDGLGVKETMEKSIKRLNKVKYGMIKGTSLMGMGTTLVSAVIDGEKAYFANVGDSRGYLFRDGKLKQITKDHSFVQALVDAGAITEEEAFDHPQKNIITNSMLTDEDVDVDVFEVIPKEGDIFLLCTDGLNDMLRDKEIENIMQTTPFEEMAKRLIDAALARGGKDNVSVILAKMED